MMMIPRRNDFDLFDEMFNDPFFTRSESKLMRTDIKDKKDHYELEVDLPGYVGECSRSFYVGDNIKEEDIKASFKNGTLKLTFPKNDQPKLEGKKYIDIE